MSKRTPEISSRKPRAVPRPETKAAGAPKPVAETATATGKRVAKTLKAKPCVTPEEILQQLQSGQPIDSTDWKGFAVEICNGQVFVSKHSGCVTKKLIDGEPLRTAPATPVVPAPETTPAPASPAVTEPATPAPIEPAVAELLAQALATAPTIEMPTPVVASNGRKLPPPPPPARNGNDGQPMDSMERKRFVALVCDGGQQIDSTDWERFAAEEVCDGKELDDDVADIPADELELEFGLPAPAEAPKETFSEQVDRLKTRVDAFESGQSTETLENLLASTGKLGEISGNLHGNAFSESFDAISTLGALTANLQRIQQRGRQPSKAEQHAAPAYFAPGTGDPDRIQPSGTPTPPLGSSAVPTTPNVQVPFLEQETQAISLDSVQAAELARIEELRGKVGELEKRVASLNKQAQALLRGEPASSGTDIPTIITFLNDLKIEITDLLNSLLTDANSNKGLIDRLKKLEGEIKGVVLSLEQKQRNGTGETAAEFVFSNAAPNPEIAVALTDNIRYYRRLLLITTCGVVGAAGLVVAGIKMCAKEKTTDELVKEALEYPEEYPLKIDPATVPTLEEIWNEYVVEKAKEEIPPTPATVAFDCEISGASQAKCSNEQYADPTETFQWTGEYNKETGTAPAQITLSTPDGKTFTAAINVAPQTEETLTGAQFVEGK